MDFSGCSPFSARAVALVLSPIAGVSFPRGETLTAASFAVPGDLAAAGLLAAPPADPNEAKAPEPRPKADDAPPPPGIEVEGALAESGERVLNGLWVRLVVPLLSGAPPLPKRFVRGGSDRSAV